MKENQNSDLMQLIKTGKTKNVYRLPNGNNLLKFKDNITIGADGKEDPGGNRAGGTKQDLGRQSLEITKYYFDSIKRFLNIPTHMVDVNISENIMEVLPIKTFGSGLEWICRAKAEGSYLKRNLNVSKGAPLNNLVEVSLKDDENNDPIFNKEAFVNGGKHVWQGKEIDLGGGVITSEQFDICHSFTVQITEFIKNDFKKRGLDFIDIKYEFGLTEENKIVLMDEISAGSMRIFDKNGSKLEKEQVYEAVIKNKINSKQSSLEK